jgi:hypothetical protein
MYIRLFALLIHQIKGKKMKKMFMLMVCIITIVNMSFADVKFTYKGTQVILATGSEFHVAGSLLQGPPDPNNPEITQLCAESQSECLVVKGLISNPQQQGDCNCPPDKIARKGIFLFESNSPVGYTNVCVSVTVSAGTDNRTLRFTTTPISQTFNNYESFNQAIPN